MPPTAISKAILFTKENCIPCDKTKAFVETINAGLSQNLVVMQKENHSALVAAYELEKYPTLLLVTKTGEVVNRFVGGETIRTVLMPTLNEIYYNE